ncbi:hypothetical protein BLOT_004147 [Blomia tropicalis]|nr:hypothetical protein BLOT_004147 [Blomia tropicalis]
MALISSFSQNVDENMIKQTEHSNKRTQMHTFASNWKPMPGSNNIILTCYRLSTDDDNDVFKAIVLQK